MENFSVCRGTILSLAFLLLQGCAASGILGALSSTVTPGVSASLQVGDDKLEVKDATVGKREESKVESKVEGVNAQREAKIDNSSQKKDQKTEISEVKGNVEVNQGPSNYVLGFLGLGWVLLAALFTYSFVRRGHE